jgi:hypothetical protein
MPWPDVPKNVSTASTDVPNTPSLSASSVRKASIRGSLLPGRKEIVDSGAYIKADFSEKLCEKEGAQATSASSS